MVDRLIIEKAILILYHFISLMQHFGVQMKMRVKSNELYWCGLSPFLKCILISHYFDQWPHKIRIWTIQSQCITVIKPDHSTNFIVQSIAWITGFFFCSNEIGALFAATLPPGQCIYKLGLRRYLICLFIFLIVLFKVIMWMPYSINAINKMYCIQGCTSIQFPANYHINWKGQCVQWNFVIKLKKQMKWT